MTDVWVVFDGYEPDSVVFGTAANLESVVELSERMFEPMQPIVIKMNAPDRVRLTSRGYDLYEGQPREATARVWRAEKHSITGA